MTVHIKWSQKKDFSLVNKTCSHFVHFVFADLYMGSPFLPNLNCEISEQKKSTKLWHLYRYINKDKTVQPAEITVNMIQSDKVMFK